MESQSEKDEIRKYLLDQLDEASAEKFDEKLLTEPEFFEMISLAEQELLDDFTAGRLGAEEYARVKFFYESSEINKKKLDFARTIRHLAVSVSQPIEPERASIAATAKGVVPDVQVIDRIGDDSSSPATVPSMGNRFLEFFTGQRLFIAAASALAVAAVAILFIWKPFLGDPSPVEKELIALNQGDQDAPGRFGGRLVDLKLESDPARDIGTVTPEIEVVENSDRIVYFRLALLTRRADLYRASFLDNKGRELFSISDLKPQTGPDGPFVSILVPARLFDARDFKINLKAQANDATLIESGSFTFRVVKK